MHLLSTCKNSLLGTYFPESQAQASLLRLAWCGHVQHTVEGDCDELANCTWDSDDFPSQSG